MASTTDSVDVAEYRRLLAAFRVSEEARKASEERARLVEENPEKAMMLKTINTLRTYERKEGKELYYDNQAATAGEVVDAIRQVGIVFQMVVAPCQAGKTGCMLATIEKLLQSVNSVNTDNIFVITGLSDTEWVTQTKKRLPLGYDKVIHRGQFKKLSLLLKNIKNALIIIDECQIACKGDMSLDKLLENTGLKNLAYLKDNNVNIVEFSATPNSTLNDIELWNTCSKTHVMKPGEGYNGHETLITNERIRQAKDLFIDNDPEAGIPYDSEVARNKKIKPAIDAVKELKRDIEEMCYSTPRFHIIRTPTSSKADTVIGRFMKIFGDEYDFKKCYIGEAQIMVELAKTPEKHTFLFIKEKARCAVTFDRKYLIGVLYERVPKTPMDDVIVQGLAGRACGYDVDDGNIVFTNIPSIQRYVNMLKSDFKKCNDFTYTGYKSKKTTHIHPVGYRNTDGEVSQQETKEDQEEPVIIKKCRNIQEARAYIKDTQIKNKKNSSRGPSPASWEKKKDKHGFYTSTSGKGENKTKVRSTQEIYAIRNWNLNATHAFTFHPCYEDVNDKQTLQWWVIHR